MNNMRNTVILKNLPSNLIEEAFVVLKKNQKIKKLEYVDNKNDNFCLDKSSNDDFDSDEFVIKEAELLILNYIDKLEKQDFCGNRSNLDMARKYKNLKVFASILGVFLMVCFWYIFKF